MLIFYLLYSIAACPCDLSNRLGHLYHLIFKRSKSALKILIKNLLVSCDINCCCDETDCSEAEILLFNCQTTESDAAECSDQIISGPDGMVSEKNGMFCIERTKLDLNYKLLSTDEISDAFNKIPTLPV